MELPLSVRYPSRMRPRVVGLLCTLLLLLAACNTPSTKEPARPAGTSPDREPVRPRPNLAAPAAPFDFYLLNLSWSPEYCHSHPSAAECAAHAAFVLHGLWPENSNGRNPEDCSNAPGPADPSEYKDIYPDPGLLQHEWSTHGTCSGLSPNAFFNEARTAYDSVVIPAKLKNLTSQVSMPPQQILVLFTQANPTIPQASLALTCGSNYLTAVEVCMDKSLHPTACTGVRTCRANVVRIPPP
jgi:ribonuclease T2